MSCARRRRNRDRAASWTGRVVERLVLEHGHQDPELSVSDAAQRSTVRVTTLPQGCVLSTAALIFLTTDPGPMIDGITQAAVTPTAHDHDRPLPTLPGDRSDAGVGPQGVVVSLVEGL